MVTQETPWPKDRGDENELVMETMFAMLMRMVAVSGNPLSIYWMSLIQQVMTMERTAVMKGACEVM